MGNLNVKSVWIVDDDAIFRMILSMTLNKLTHGLKVSEFDGGDSFLHQFGTTVPASMPDVVLLDINMPGKTGWDVLDELVKASTTGKPLSPKIYVVSSSINPEDQSRAATFPISAGFLVKPISESELRRVLDLG